ncbi:MAG TPA: hypothetical protein VFJ72_03600 [Rubrobacteraceae bacterium]|nr:hypothetical protein [Rubrobacteraceae bacterium]
MSNENRDLVRRAFEACQQADTTTLKQCFSYDRSVQIQGLARPNPYPAGSNVDLHYDTPVEEANSKVRTSYRLKTDDGSEYHAEVVDTIENKKISSSVVTWTDWDPSGNPEDDAAWYEGKYGWWGWPFGRGWW